MEKLVLAMQNPETKIQCDNCGKSVFSYKGIFTGYDNESFVCSDKCHKEY